MKVLKQAPYYTSVIDVEHDGSTYRRSARSDGLIDWKPTSYDGDCDEGKLEEIFSLMLDEMREKASDTLTIIRKLKQGSNDAKLKKFGL